MLMHCSLFRTTLESDGLKDSDTLIWLIKHMDVPALIVSNRLTIWR